MIVPIHLYSVNMRALHVEHHCDPLKYWLGEKEPHSKVLTQNAVDGIAVNS